MKGFELKFNIYAENEAEVAEARNAIVSFINANADEGRAITARKVADVVPKWRTNPFVKQQIVNLFS